MQFINTPDHFCTLLQDLLKLAKKGGATAAEAAVSEGHELSVSARCGKLDEMNINRDQELNLTVYINGKSGHASATALTQESLRTLAERAIAIARATSEDPHAGLADPRLLAKNFPDLSLYHRWDLTPDDALTLALTAEQAAWDASPLISREKSEGAAVHTACELSAYANSHGFCAAEKSSMHGISCTALAENPPAKTPAMETDGWSEDHRRPEALPGAQSIGAQAGQRAARRLGGGEVSDCRAAVLFQAPAAHSLIRHFIGAASGGALYRNTSFLLGKIGSRIFPPHLTIRELPHLPQAHASCNYDADGVATNPREVVTDGIWNAPFLSAYSARKLGMQTTANAGGAHNLEVIGHTEPAANLPALLKRGLIVTDLMGQGVNPVTGDYSRGAAGFWVENGEIVYPVSEVTIAGNLLNILPSITAVGDDAMRRGGILCGSLLAPDLVIGGNKGKTK